VATCQGLFYFYKGGLFHIGGGCVGFVAINFASTAIKQERAFTFEAARLVKNAFFIVVFGVALAVSAAKRKMSDTELTERVGGYFRISA